MKYEDMLELSRPPSSHLHMDIRNRAKQFAPFDALRGFNESIREAAVIYSDPPDLCEDRKEELERILEELSPGEEVQAVYFQESEKVWPKGSFQTIQGKVTGLERRKRLWIEETEIPLVNLVDLRWIRDSCGYACE